RIAVSRIFSRVSIRERSCAALLVSHAAFVCQTPRRDRCPGCGPGAQSPAGGGTMKTRDDGEKDKLGDTLHDKKKGEEDSDFAEREAAALRRLRESATAGGADAPCPRCGQPFARTPGGAPATTCPSGHAREVPPASR